MDDAPALVAAPDSFAEMPYEHPPAREPVLAAMDFEAPELNAAPANFPLRIVEALLFAADVPLSLHKLVELVGAGTQTSLRLTIAALNDQYRDLGLAFRIEEIARGYQMMTLPEYKPFLAKLNRQRAETRLSDAMLETLSIIAYKQPIIRADVEAIRGVGCGDQIGRLREMGLVRLIGRAEVVGRPMLYGTTKKFLDLFGLVDLDDLPPMEALKLRPVGKPKAATAPAYDDPANGEPDVDRSASAARRPIIGDEISAPQALAGA